MTYQFTAACPHCGASNIQTIDDSHATNNVRDILYEDGQVVRNADVIEIGPALMFCLNDSCEKMFIVKLEFEVTLRLGKVNF